MRYTVKETRAYFYEVEADSREDALSEFEKGGFEAFDDEPIGTEVLVTLSDLERAAFDAQPYLCEWDLSEVVRWVDCLDYETLALQECGCVAKSRSGVDWHPIAQCDQHQCMWDGTGWKEEE